ncbi:DUF1289 domain-containing protein [Lysobacter sp. CAU 1642]|uniref:DUF1289 domain-containing protein n=1 Tax=Pseudomarimonas salicorniae TaxID=2933270 RepID=A0ABT0GL94_9GAMM|nr:DUF1289 domain-containing protein [Lysobacter sp. CAU 1642]
MFNWSGPAAKPLMTPCIGICQLGDDGLCEGCFRSGDEIAAWASLSDAERTRLMDEILPGREASRAG